MELARGAFCIGKGKVKGTAARCCGQSNKKAPLTKGFSVGDTGIEPVTSSVSGKRATAAPIARGGDGI